MFKTIGNTWFLMQASWRVLQQDKRLLLLPAMSAGAITCILAVAIAGIALLGPSGTAAESDESSFTAAEYVLFAVLYFLLTFTIIYFNSALVSAAYNLMRGGRPTIGSSLGVANKHLGSIFGWACFSTTIGLVLDALRNGDGPAMKVVAWIVSTIWAYMTYFVVPVLVIEGVSPFQAVKRSTELLRATWGRQIVANFGFGFAYIILAVAAAVPAIAVSGSDLGLALVILFYSLPVFLGGAIVLVALEGIFRAGLYQYATTGEGSSYFPSDLMRQAYVGKEDRGSWGGGSSSDFRYRGGSDQGTDIINRYGGPGFA